MQFSFFTGMSASDRGESKTSVKTTSKIVIAALQFTAIWMLEQRGECCASDKNWHASMAASTGELFQKSARGFSSVQFSFQVENSRQMYRAIMEEVARYLEKCHLNFELLQQRERETTMERSKSIANIAKGKLSEHTRAGRAQSSTNLYSLNTLQPHKQQKSGTLLSDLSYSAFKDFTWWISAGSKLSNQL